MGQRIYIELAARGAVRNEIECKVNKMLRMLCWYGSGSTCISAGCDCPARTVTPNPASAWVRRQVSMNVQSCFIIHWREGRLAMVVAAESCSEDVCALHLFQKI